VEENERPIGSLYKWNFMSHSKVEKNYYKEISEKLNIIRNGLNFFGTTFLLLEQRATRLNIISRLKLEGIQKAQLRQTNWEWTVVEKQ